MLRARASGKGVLTAPFPLLKTKRLGVILTFAVYKRELLSNATPNERIQATDGYVFLKHKHKHFNRVYLLFLTF